MHEIITSPFLRHTFNVRYGRKIIPFPGVSLNDSEYQNPKKEGVRSIILARPGEKLPESIPDFRSMLQRDGLILLSWDKRFCEKGTLYTAYWVTSSGILRYYASPALYIEDFVQAMPNRKSYAAEDGIDFYGEAGPDYIVHVAPELMMSSSQKLKQRPVHINKLRTMGVGVDFDYSFLLKTERKKRSSNHGNKRGA